MRRGPLALLLFVALLGTTPLPAGAWDSGLLQPLMWGWEQLFEVEYGPGEYHGQPAVEGYVINVSHYGYTRIRILIDALDAGGHVIAQRVAYLPGGIGGGDEVFFQVPAPPAPAYRVQVFDYDRREGFGNKVR
jgi:hypothetical protein